jgi:hypothetical protein
MMIDKSIPYCNIVMMRKAGKIIPDFPLPNDFQFKNFSHGDEHIWAEIETSVGEYDNISDGLEYFKKSYLPLLSEVERRTFFIETKNGKKIATATNWWNYTDKKRIPEVHWVAVMPKYQNLHLGKAIIFEGMRRMLMIEGDIDIFVHTQTWSYKAIGIYLHAGFEFIKDGSFAQYQNDYEKAVPILKRKMQGTYSI